MSKKPISRNRKSNAGTLSLSSLLVALVLIVVYFLSGGEFDLETLESILSSATSSQRPVVVSAGGEGWYEIYFTNPSCPPENERRGGLDETIAADLRSLAQRQVDVAAYELNAEPIVAALVDLANSGVEVRLVTDSDNADWPAVNRLRRARVPVVEDNRSAFMHNKFIIIDESIVWTGSMNFTTNDTYCNNNNLVRFESPELAANYTAEFNEMFADGSFGATSPVNTPYERIEIDGILVENYFGPETRLAPIIGQIAATAQEEILFMAFSFTIEDIGELILARAREGVTVRGVFERVGSNTDWSYFPPMRDANIPNLQVRQDGNPRMMHHKVLIVDREVTVFGSFNFSANANNNNDENIVIVYDPIFTSYFVEEFEVVWSEARLE